MHLDNYEHVLEVRADGFGGERHGPWLLEDDRHNIVPYVSFPQQLRGKQRRLLVNTAQMLTLEYTGYIIHQT